MAENEIKKPAVEPASKPSQGLPPRSAAPAPAAPAKKEAEGTPMTRAAMDAPAAEESASAAARRNRSNFGAMPGPAELKKIRKAKFGDKAGTVRVDAQPANAGGDAPATQLVFVDGRGREVGRESYVPGNYR